MSITSLDRYICSKNRETCSLSPRPAKEKDEKLFPHSSGLGVLVSEVCVANVEK